MVVATAQLGRPPRSRLACRMFMSNWIEDFATALDQHDLSYLKETVVTTARPCVEMFLTAAGEMVFDPEFEASLGVDFSYRDQTMIGMSKLGGSPDLPKGFEWPRIDWEEADGPVPIPFLAQIDLAEVSKFDSEHRLPRAGMLYLFCDHTLTLTGLDACRCFWVEEPGSLERSPRPADAFEFAEHAPFQITFGPAWAARHVCSLEVEDAFRRFGPAVQDERFAAMDRYSKLVRSVTPYHALLAYQRCRHFDVRMEVASVSAGEDFHVPYNTPATPELYEEINQWQLLFQFDCEMDKEVSWGNGGLIYGYIKSEALIRRDFSKVIFVWQ